MPASTATHSPSSAAIARATTGIGSTNGFFFFWLYRAAC